MSKNAKKTAKVAEVEQVQEANVVETSPKEEANVVETSPKEVNVVAPTLFQYLDQMTLTQKYYVWECCAKASLIDEMTEEDQIDDVLDRLEGISLTDIIIACSEISDPSILEIFMSRPVARVMDDTPVRVSKEILSGHIRPNGSRADGKIKTEKGPRVKAIENRVIVRVAPNTKKPSGKSYARYELYQVGMTVQEFIAAGGTHGDISYDLNRNSIELSDKAAE